jgi:hypothetical protein
LTSSCVKIDACCRTKFLVKLKQISALPSRTHALGLAPWAALWERTASSYSCADLPRISRRNRSLLAYPSESFFLGAYDKSASALDPTSQGPGFADAPSRRAAFSYRRGRSAGLSRPVGAKFPGRRVGAAHAQSCPSFVLLYASRQANERLVSSPASDWNGLKRNPARNEATERGKIGAGRSNTGPVPDWPNPVKGSISQSGELAVTH